MTRFERAIVALISFVCIGYLYVGNWQYAAIAGFIAIMWLLMGIEEQL